MPNHRNKKKKRQVGRKKYKYYKFNHNHIWTCCDSGSGTIVRCNTCLRKAGKTNRTMLRKIFIPGLGFSYVSGVSGISG